MKPTSAASWILRHCGVRFFPLAIGVFVTLSPLPLPAQKVEDAAVQTTPPASASTAVSTPQNPTGDDIDRWIAELSSDAFTVRQAATTRLLAAGISARNSLVTVAEGPDPEVRAAARRLVSLIDQGEFHRRLEAFAADTDGKRRLTLPGWKEYRALVGGDPAARALFVEMQKQEGPLLSAVFDSSAEAPEKLWEERLMRLVGWPAAIGDRGAVPPLGSCAAMLFLGTAAEMNVSDRGATLLENMIQRPPLREAIAVAAETPDAVRRLVSSWILHCPNKSEMILLRRLSLASAIDLKEALPLALAVAGGDPQYASVPPTVHAVAILLIGQIGNREHVNHLEPLLEDTTVCMPVQAPIPGQPAPNVQIRDVALVVMIHLTGQRAADYGYIHARLQPQRMFQLQTLHRENDEQRVAAAAKWRTWRKNGGELKVEGREPAANEENGQLPKIEPLIEPAADEEKALP
jgi:hypothetical protein